MKQSRRVTEYELEVTEGLEAFAQADVARSLKLPLVATTIRRPGVLRLRFGGSAIALKQLRSAESVFSVQHFDVPRPKALMGDQHFKRLLAQIAVVLKDTPGMRTFYIDAAGSDSSVMQRLRDEIAGATRLQYADPGDLQVRIAPASDGGWEALVRLTARPLSARSWRVSTFDAALNATVGYAMGVLADPTGTATLLNLCAGSGTIAIERGRAASVIALELESGLIEAGRKNARAAGAAGIQWLQADARAVPLQDGCIGALCADLPFGQNSGSHETNRKLYPHILHEAGRISRPGARLVALTHEVRLMTDSIAASPLWTLEETIRINLRGLHPGIYVLTRSGASARSHAV